STPLAEIDFAALDRTTLATGAEAVATFAAAVEEWKLLTAAGLAGLSRESLKLAAAYACERQQFGQAIGQRVRDRLEHADRLCDTDAARLLTWKAIRDIHDGAAEAGAAIPLALWWASTTADRTVTQALHTLENSPNAPEELRGLLRELQRHQLELELQNRELQEAQQALEESRNRYMELYDFAPMACASLDANGCIQDLNLTGANLLGQNRSYLQGLPFTPFVDPVDVGRFFGHLRQCIDGETVSTELRLRIARRQVEVRLVSAPLEDTGSPVRMCRTAIFDITELRQMQVRLSLAERLAAVGTLAAGIAHEVNNPLAFLMGSLSLATHALRAPAPSSVDPELLAVARHHTGASQALEALGHAQAGAERIQDIVKDLGAFARPTAPRERSVNVEQVLELALKMAMVEIQHRAHVVRDYTPVPEVVADSVRLGQVFLNLLVNAAQAIPEGMASRHEIRVRLRASAEGVFVHIQDTGEGMAPDILEHIFDPFFTTRPMGQGLGLGLAISHNLVSQMNGAITVDSAPDQGST
ncbi:MAG: PAS domain S-box protein, partial [Myxococcaceae bacterium]